MVIDVFRLKAAASDKASQQRGGRHFLVRNRCEVAQELHESVHFGVLRTVLRNSHEHSLGMGSDDRKFHYI